MDVPAHNGENAGAADPTHRLDGRLDGLVPATSEAAYDALAAYGFVRPYVAGKTVADIGWHEVGRGSLILAEKAGMVVGLAGSAEAAELASAAFPAPNVAYREADLPTIPLPDDHLDVVVAFGVLGRLRDPEGLVREARRVLKADGVFVVSVPDRLRVRETRGREDGSGMYAIEARGLLERHFPGVRLYRQGAVAGGFVFPDPGADSGEVKDVRVESARLSFAAPSLGSGPPKTRHMVAVCGEGGVFGEEEGAYLFLDRDRRVFDECEDRAEDAELVREEIRRVQETEAQAFQEALKLHRSEISFLRAQVRRSEARVRQVERDSEARIARSESSYQKRVRELQARIRDMENSATWRVFEPYRRLRTRVDAARGSAPGNPGRGSEGGDDNRPG